MMIVPLLGEAEAIVPGLGDEGADLKLHLKLGNAEWVLAERTLSGTSYLDIIGSLVAAELSGRSASLDTTRAVLWAATRRHHSTLTLEDCGELVTQFGGIVLGPLGEAIRGSIKTKEPESGEAEPAKAPAEKKGGTGTTS
jgi:hypothetical protein